MKRAMIRSATWLLAFSMGITWAANQPVPINNGMSTLKIRGTDFQAFRAWRENYNAHGFDVVTFYYSNNDTWGLVPLFDDAKTNEKLELTAGGGADCRLHDFRLLVSSDARSAQLLVATRAPGSSYVSSEIVHFVYYDLEKNVERSPGAPLYVFQTTRRSHSKATYCDVNDAINNELHLGERSGFCGKDCPGR